MIFVAGLGMLGSTTVIVPVLCRFMLFLSSIVAFNANVTQFGLDQLHDAPAESSSLYIHWYVRTNQVGLFLLIDFLLLCYQVIAKLQYMPSALCEPLYSTYFSSDCFTH